MSQTLCQADWPVKSLPAGEKKAVTEPSCDIVIYCEIPSLECLHSNEVLPPAIFSRKDLERNVFVYFVKVFSCLAVTWPACCFSKCSNCV